MAFWKGEKLQKESVEDPATRSRREALTEALGKRALGYLGAPQAGSMRGQLEDVTKQIMAGRAPLGGEAVKSRYYEGVRRPMMEELEQAKTRLGQKATLGGAFYSTGKGGEERKLEERTLTKLGDILAQMEYQDLGAQRQMQQYGMGMAQQLGAQEAGLLSPYMQLATYQPPMEYAQYAPSEFERMIGYGQDIANIWGTIKGGKPVQRSTTQQPKGTPFQPAEYGSTAYQGKAGETYYPGGVPVKTPWTPSSQYETPETSFGGVEGYEGGLPLFSGTPPWTPSSQYEPPLTHQGSQWSQYPAGKRISPTDIEALGGWGSQTAFTPKPYELLAEYGG